MEPVRELDDDHPHVVGNGQKELGQVLVLLLLLGDVLLLPGPGQLGDAVHQVGYLRGEPLGDIIDGDAFAVLHRVVEHPGDDRGGVHAHVQQVFRHGDGMDDVGFTGLPLLVPMDSRSKGHGFLHGLPLLRAEFGAEFLEQFFLCHPVERGINAAADPCHLPVFD